MRNGAVPGTGGQHRACAYGSSKTASSRPPSARASWELHVVYAAGAQINNDLTMSFDAATKTYTFTDTAETITLTGHASLYFTGDGTHTVTGGSPLLQSISVDLGDGTNQVTLEGTGGVVDTITDLNNGGSEQVN